MNVSRVSAILFMAMLSTAQSFAASVKSETLQIPPQPKVRPAGLPAGYVMVSPCIQAMGEHWANPKDLTGTIYGTYKGKTIFSEAMIPVTNLNKGYTDPNLKALSGHTIDHVSIEWHPNGHEGLPFPHYDVHAYYISLAQQRAICPNGIPDPDAKMDMKMSK